MSLQVGIVTFAGVMMIGIVFGNACASPTARAQNVDVAGWTIGPAGTKYVDMPDGVRCYRYGFSDVVSCVKL